MTASFLLHWPIAYTALLCHGAIPNALDLHTPPGTTPIRKTVQGPVLMHAFLNSTVFVMIPIICAQFFLVPLSFSPTSCVQS